MLTVTGSRGEAECLTEGCTRSQTKKIVRTLQKQSSYTLRFDACVQKSQESTPKKLYPPQSVAAQHV